MARTSPSQSQYGLCWLQTSSSLFLTFHSSIHRSHTGDGLIPSSASALNLPAPPAALALRFFLSIAPHKDPQRPQIMMLETFAIEVSYSCEGRRIVTLADNMQLVWQIGLAIEDEKELLSFSLSCRHVHTCLNDPNSRIFWRRRFAMFYDLPESKARDASARELQNLVQWRYACVLRQPPDFSQKPYSRRHVECALHAFHLVRESYSGGTNNNVRILRQLSRNTQFEYLLRVEWNNSMPDFDFEHYRDEASIHRAGDDCSGLHGQDGHAGAREDHGNNHMPLCELVACMMSHFWTFEEQLEVVDTDHGSKSASVIAHKEYSLIQLGLYADLASPFVLRQNDLYNTWSMTSWLNIVWLKHACVFWRYHLEIGTSIGQYYRRLDASQRIQCWMDRLESFPTTKRLGSKFLSTWFTGIRDVSLLGDQNSWSTREIFDSIGDSWRDLKFQSFTLTIIDEDATPPWPAAIHDLLPRRYLPVNFKALYVQIVGQSPGPE